VCEFFDEDFACCVLLIWSWKSDSTSICEIFLEDLKVGTFDSKVELQFHHFGKLVYFIWKRKPFHRRNGVDDIGEKAHDTEISVDSGSDARMKDFDCDMSGRYLLG